MSKASLNGAEDTVTGSLKDLRFPVKLISECYPTTGKRHLPALCTQPPSSPLSAFKRHKQHAQQGPAQSIVSSVQPFSFGSCGNASIASYPHAVAASPAGLTFRAQAALIPLILATALACRSIIPPLAYDWAAAEVWAKKCLIKSCSPPMQCQSSVTPLHGSPHPPHSLLFPGCRPTRGSGGTPSTNLRAV